jgi:hypothetical protein
MDPKELRGLMEAYSEVYAPQQIDELSNRKLRAYIKKSGKSHAEISKKWDQGTATDKEKSKSIGHEIGQHRAFRTLDKRARKEDFEFWVDSLIEEGYDLSDYTWDEMLDIYLDEASSRDEFTRAAIARNSGRKGGITFEPGPNWDSSANRGKGAHISPKQKEKQRRKGLRQEELDIFDIVLEFLQVEGYAETLEEAEWIMANELDSEDIEEILEAEGSYGQTPKARTAMGKLAIDRMRRPASEYSQRGEKTKKLKAAEKQTRRQDTLSQGKSGGKKSSRPWAIRGKMDADERSERRAERAFDGDNTYGAGSVTKNPKKLRKQKAMGEHD